MIYETQETSAPGPSSAAAASADAFAIRGVRTEEALHRFAGDQERYRHWLIEFIQHGPATASQIRLAVANGSRESAIGLSHSFKGRTGMLGMAELHSIALSLEKALRDNESPALWLEELELTVSEMSKEISAVLGTSAA